MKPINFAIFLVILSIAAVAPKRLFDDAFYEEEFDIFMKKYDKYYFHDNFLRRFENFKDNLDMIVLHNYGNSSYDMEMNEFGDLSFDEFKAQYATFDPKDFPQSDYTEVPQYYGAIPTSLDWRTKNVVSPVKNQGSGCGSCWAFCSTGAIESALAIKTGILYYLSEQQLVDCTEKYGNRGCQGGNMLNSFQYVVDKGICSSNDYRYKAVQMTCNDTKCRPITKLRGYNRVKAMNETELINNLLRQPISIAIEVTKSFQFYSSGIYEGPCGVQLNHAMLLVGFGVEKNKGFYLVKNSWGGWGESGYIRMVRKNTSSYNAGICGITMMASYPIV
jgi:hypothetical protein